MNENEQDKPPAPDGPLTRLVENQSGAPQAAPHEAALPQPPELKRKGRDDYASGTPEHEDDRET